MKMRQNWVSWLYFLPLLLIAVILFQNCTTNFEEQGSMFPPGGEGDLEPVAFDTVVDTLAYMSCEGMDANYHERAYFTFKAGAYNQGSGIKFTDKYFDWVRFENLESRVRRLKETVNNLGVYLQMGIHQQGSYLVFPVSGAGIKTQEIYDMNVLGVLSDEIYASQIAELEEGQRINYFRGLSGFNGKVIEGRLSLVEQGSIAQDSMRNLLEGVASQPGLITLGYTRGDLSSGKLLGLDGSAADKTAFGHGYRLTFGSGHRYDYLGHQIISPYVMNNDDLKSRRLSLSAVTELNLNGGQPISEAQWNCPPEARFMIFRPQDIKKEAGDLDLACGVNIHGDEDLTLLDRKLTDTEKAISLTLRPEDWSIDFQKRCIVPKHDGGQCYGSQYGTLNSRVNYYGNFSSGKCGHGVEVELDLDGDLLTTERVHILCPHYVSFCFRK